MRQEERKTIHAAILGAVLFLLIQIFRTPLGRIEDKDLLIAFYLILGCCTVAFGFAIFAQGWLLFANSLSKARLYTSALFLGVSIFDFLHVLGFVGIPGITSYISPEQSLWLLTFSRLASALGIMLIFSREDQLVGNGVKGKVFRNAFVVILLSLAVFGLGNLIVSGLADEPWAETARDLMNMAILFVYLLGAAIIIYPGKSEKSASLLIIIRSLVFFSLAQVFFMNLFSVGELDYLFGMLSSAAAYYLLLTGVYRLTIEEPFQENQQAEARINYLAYHDELTGLPNRRRLMQRMEEVVLQSEQDKSRGFAGLVIMNINHFKNINDSLGHYAGDLLLQLVARRIGDEVRVNEELFSMGADEFAFLMTERTGLENCLVRAGELLRLFETPVGLESGEYHISLSLGVSIYPGDGDTAEQLIQNADTAVHNAKDQGVEIRRYIPAMQMKAKERLKLENDLRRALERGSSIWSISPRYCLRQKRLSAWRRCCAGTIPNAAWSLRWISFLSLKRAG